MQIDLILIGDELLKGKVTDINGPYLANALKKYDCKIGRIAIVSDNLDKLAVELASAYHRSSIVITSGGLGPTGDDCTKLALAKALNLPIVESESAKEVVLGNYSRKNRKWDPSLNQYHRIPKGMVALNNPVGHAPALKYLSDNKQLLALPGVPQEFQSIIDQELPKLGLPQRSTKIVTACTREVPEEVIFGTLCPNLWSELEKYGPVSSLPTPGGVVISVECEADKYDEVHNLVMNSPLAPHIWQEGDLGLFEYTFLMLKEKKLTVAFAESCTGGLAANLMTNFSGSSEVLRGGVVSYCNEVKINSLGVDPKLIEKYTEVSPQVAEQMAQGARERLGADIGVSFTGYAGPSGGTESMPVGTVCIGVSTKQSTFAEVYHFNGTRDFLKMKFAVYGYYKLLDLATA